jgi:hypothetical protein
MSEVDRLSNSGLYPALPIADKRPSKDGSSGRHGADKRRDNAVEKPAPKAGEDIGAGAPRPPKSVIDEYA